MDKKREILQKLTAVIAALENVTVKGRANLNNLGGSIEMLERLREDIRSIESPETTEQGGIK